MTMHYEQSIMRCIIVNTAGHNLDPAMNHSLWVITAKCNILFNISYLYVNYAKQPC